MEFVFQINGLEIVVKGEDLHRSLAESLARSAVEALQQGIAEPVLCPGGFRTELGLGGEHAVCYNAFKVIRTGSRVIVEEIGYYREKIQ